MIKVAILEDESKYAVHLYNLLEDWAKEKAELDISLFKNGEALFAEMNASDILALDIIFLDIEMGRLSGVDTAKKLRAMGFKHTIVFTTNFENRARDGYSVQAFDFYIKPVTFRNVKECMNYVMDKNAGDYFQYCYHGVTNRIEWDDIICIESMGHYIDILTSDRKTIHIKYLLKDVQRQCPPNIVRCQRSYVVNCNYIKARFGNKLLLRKDKFVEIAPKFSKVIADAMKKNEK